MDKYKVLYTPGGDVNLVPENVGFQDSINPGFYKVKETDMGFGTSLSLGIDNSIEIPNNSMRIAKSQIDLKYLLQYFSETSKQIHKKLGLKHKLGYMLYGIQGTGKTTSCYTIAEYLIKNHNAIVVTVTSLKQYSMVNNFLNDAKAKLGDFLSITIFDECESDMYNHEGHFKRLLDSSSSINNHISFFTTNRIDYVSDAIKDRPSRIKFCTEIGGIEDELVIHEIISNMNNPLNDEVKLSEEDLASIIPELKGKTLDEVKNSFLDTVFEVNFNKKVLVQQAQQATL